MAATVSVKVVRVLLHVFYAASLSVPNGIRPTIGCAPPHAPLLGLFDVVELLSPWSPPPVGRIPVQDKLDLHSITTTSSHKHPFGCY